MSQSAAAPPPAQVAAPPARMPSAAPAPASAPAAATPSILDPAVLSLGSIPDKLTRLRVLTATALVLLSLAVAALMAVTWQYGRDAASDTQQLARVEAMRADLLRADALATNSFLVAGLEDPAQRAAYDTALTQVTSTIAEAAGAQPADRVVLAKLGEQVLVYAGRIEQARATNRQGLPVGAAYLKSASAGLRSDALPLLEQLVVYNQNRAESAMDMTFRYLIFVPGALALLLLIWVHRWVAKAFHRRWNTGLLAAAAIVAGALAGAAGLQWVNASAIDSMRLNDYNKLVVSSEMRAAANDAKANESLYLVARGSGAAFEKAWQSSAERVKSLLGEGAPAAGSWGDYSAAHAEVVDLDKGGRWDLAVARVTDTAAGSSSASFAEFDRATSESVTNAATAISDTLAGRSWPLLIAAALVALSGLAAAAAAWRGISRRLQEYEQ